MASMTNHTDERRPRAVLTETQVLEIFRIKLPGLECSPNSNVASLVASKYGVNEKTVRDIWKGRTWRRTTGQVYECRLPSLQSRPKKPRMKNEHGTWPITRQDEKKERSRSKTRAISSFCCTNKLCRWGETRCENDLDHTNEPKDDVSVDTMLHLWILQEPRPSDCTDPFRGDCELLDQLAAASPCRESWPESSGSK